MLHLQINTDSIYPRELDFNLGSYSAKKLDWDKVVEGTSVHIDKDFLDNHYLKLGKKIDLGSITPEEKPFAVISRVDKENGFITIRQLTWLTLYSLKDIASIELPMKAS